MIGLFKLLLFKLKMACLFMLNLLFASLLIAQVIKVSQGMNGELNLCIIKTDKGSKVRLIPKEKMIQSFYIDSFEITGKRTRLNTKYGFICGNLLNDKITLCKHQAWKTKFTIESDSAGSIWFMTDKGKCLTKGESDQIYGGFKLSLKTCDGAKEQMFSLNVDNMNPCDHLEILNLVENSN